jgi:hypothetical protein
MRRRLPFGNASAGRRCCARFPVAMPTKRRMFLETPRPRRPVKGRATSARARIMREPSAFIVRGRAPKRMGNIHEDWPSWTLAEASHRASWTIGTLDTRYYGPSSPTSSTHSSRAWGRTAPTVAFAPWARSPTFLLACRRYRGAPSGRGRTVAAILTRQRCLPHPTGDWRAIVYEGSVEELGEASPPEHRPTILDEHLSPYEYEERSWEIGRKSISLLVEIKYRKSQLLMHYPARLKAVLAPA